MLTLSRRMGDRASDHRALFEEFIFKANHDNGEKSIAHRSGGEADRGSRPGKPESSSWARAGQ